MKAKDFVNEKWTEKYKKSINCQNPKGFSQKAHCAGRKKNEDAAATMPNTEIPDITKEPGALKKGAKKLGKVLGKGLGALDFIDAANKFSKGDIPGGAESTLSGITYAVPVVGLPLGLARDVAKSAGYDPLDVSSKSYPKDEKGRPIYQITPFESKSNVLKGIVVAEQSDFSQMLKNITAQNPRGSAAEQILLGKFLGSDQGTYARNVLGKNHKGWIEHIASWLKKYQPRLEKEFNELDFSDLQSLAYDMYENYLAKQGQLEEGEVVSLQARKTPLVVAGHPFDWNVYDLRNNKMVANVIGGDRSDSKLYEIRIKSSGMTDETRMLPTYLLTAGPNDNPPYKAYELVAPPEKFSKIEKSPGPGGTTKLRPDEDDKLRHFFKILGAGRYYGYDVMLVEEGLDQWDLIEKALGAKIMDTDDAMELGYTDVDPEDSSGIVYLGNKKNKDINEFFDTGGGGDDDDELKRQVIEMYKEDGLRELEISKITGLSEIAVHKIIDAYERGDFELDEGYSAGAAGGVGLGEELKEYGEYDTKRIIQFSKDNPPDLDYLYQQFVQRMLNPENTVDPNEWIEKVNDFYGLKYGWKDYQTRGRNDHTNNWQRIINRYVVNKNMKEGKKLAGAALAGLMALNPNLSKAQDIQIIKEPVPASKMDIRSAARQTGKKYGFENLLGNLFSPGQDKETLLKNIQKIHDKRPVELGQKTGTLTLIPSTVDSDYIARIPYENGILDIHLQKGGEVKGPYTTYDFTDNSNNPLYKMLWIEWRIGKSSTDNSNFDVKE